MARGGRKTEVNGILFDSKIEAGYYRELLLRERAGEIRNIELQPSYDLWAWFPDVTPHVDVDQKAKIGRYTADFRFEEIRSSGDMGPTTNYWAQVVVDVKPARRRRKRDGRLMKDMAGEAFKLRQKIVEANHGIELTIARR